MTIGSSNSIRGIPMLTASGAHFNAGHIDQSINDFDRSIEPETRREPFPWQRGISNYYASRFEDGKRQFESHQTVNSI